MVRNFTVYFEETTSHAVDIELFDDEITEGENEDDELMADKLAEICQRYAEGKVPYAGSVLRRRDPEREVRLVEWGE